MIRCVKISKADAHNEEVNDMLSQIENEYDWTLTIQTITKNPIEKKKIIQSYIVIFWYIKKYGPLGQIQIKLLPLPGSEDPEEKLGVVKLKFLGVKSCWNMYRENFEQISL